jgi:hypothetical protein
LARFRDELPVPVPAAPGERVLGEQLFCERTVEVIEGRSYTYAGELARIRAHNFGHANAPPPYCSAPYRQRSLRRS